MAALGAFLAAAAVRVQEAELGAVPDRGPPLHAPVWRVDLDAAEAEELMLLPGVGAGLADRIVRDRRLHGPFRGADGLERVPGIGPALIERLRPLVR